MSARTPGPWLMACGTDEPPRVEARGGTIAHVVRYQVGDNEARVNAHLIAAAPELLAALRQLTDAYCAERLESGDVVYLGNRACFEDRDELDGLVTRAWQDALSALTKAERSK